MPAAIAIFAITLTLVIWQPRGLGIGWSALGGAAIALLVGVIHLANIPEVWNIVWNATFTFVAVILISLVLDAAGFFEWAALHVSRWGRGHSKLLFVLIILLGAAVASVFANDGAALILTPIVMEILLALDFSPAASLAFVMACGFIADTTSLPLVVSNLVNIVSADYFHIGFATYAKEMIPVDIVSLLASTAALYLYFHRRLPSEYHQENLKEPTEAIRDPLTFKVGWWVLLVVLAGYFLASDLGIPISAVAGAGALVLLATAGRLGPARLTRLGPGSPATTQRSDPVISPTRIIREAPWQIVLFSLGMYLVVFGLRNEGLTTDIAKLLVEISKGGSIASSLGMGFLAAGLSSIMNNMPTVMIGALSIHASATHGMDRHAMVLANVVGSDLGPKITPIGSLATLLWLHVLQKKGLRIGWGTYFRIGIVLTLPVLAITLLGLSAWLSVAH